MATTGNRAEKARITMIFAFKRICRAHTSWIAMPKMKASVVMSRLPIASHFSHCFRQLRSNQPTDLDLPYSCTAPVQYNAVLDCIGP